MSDEFNKTFKNLHKNSENTFLQNDNKFFSSSETLIIRTRISL